MFTVSIAWETLVGLAHAGRSWLQPICSKLRSVRSESSSIFVSEGYIKQGLNNRENMLHIDIRGKAYKIRTIHNPTSRIKRGNTNPINLQELDQKNGWFQSTNSLNSPKKCGVTRLETNPSDIVGCMSHNRIPQNCMPIQYFFYPPHVFLDTNENSCSSPQRSKPTHQNKASNKWMSIPPNCRIGLNPSRVVVVVG